MATYSNPHWLLCHIRNSFISTDDTGMCETVMISDDLPKHYLKRFQGGGDGGSGGGGGADGDSKSKPQQQQQRNSNGSNNGAIGKHSGAQPKNVDPVLQEVDFICYPGLDQSDDEDLDLSTQSYDIQMYPEIGAHRLRSNTAQKLEKMDIARRKAARTKCVKVDDELLPPERMDFLVRKEVRTTPSPKEKSEEKPPEPAANENASKGGVRSKLALQLANSPKQAQNKFMEYAKFDGTSQVGIQTKRINVYLSMLPEKERNFPIKICVIASAKIIEVIGLVCYKATIQYPEIPLKSVRHYGLYMTEDNDDMEDFPPLDNREPCSKFGFSQLTLAERRPLVPVTRIDYNNLTSSATQRSINSEGVPEDEKFRLTAMAVRTLQGIELNGSGSKGTGEKEDEGGASSSAAQTPMSEEQHISDYEERILNHTDMLEAPMYRTYRLNIIDKRFFRSEVSLGISGERIEIDPHKHAKFWTKSKAMTYAIDSVAFCEITEKKQLKATLRIWLKASNTSGSPTKCFPKDTLKSSSLSMGGGGGSSSSSTTIGQQSPTSPGVTYFRSPSSPLFFFQIGGGSGGLGSSQRRRRPPQLQYHSHIRFKHYDFEADLHTATQILNKLNCILEVRSSEARREFLHLWERKQEKLRAKKQLKL